MTEFQNPLTVTSFAAFLKGVVKILIYIGIAFCPLMLIYAGYLLATSEGKPENFETFKRSVVYAIVGLGIIFLAYPLIEYFRDIIFK